MLPLANGTYTIFFTSPCGTWRWYNYIFLPYFIWNLMPELQDITITHIASWSMPLTPFFSTSLASSGRSSLFRAARSIWCARTSACPASRARSSRESRPSKSSSRSPTSPLPEFRWATNLSFFSHHHSKLIRSNASCFYGYRTPN